MTTAFPFPLLVVGVQFIHGAEASNPFTSIGDWLQNGHKNGTLTLKEEIQCYSLPYGSIGFISHILTYYSVAMLSVGRSPWTWQKNQHRIFDMCLASMGLLATFIVSVLTIVRCRSRWQFITVAVWKLVLSVALGCLSFHAASLIGYTEFENVNNGYNEDDGMETTPKNRNSTSTGRARKSPARILWWTTLYVPGVIVGMVGLLSLVVEVIAGNRTVERITLVFGTVIATFIVLFMGLGIMTAAMDDEGLVTALGYSSFGVFIAGAGGVAFLGALYSDWVLGGIAENLVGIPSTDNAVLYWTYFIAKRLPFFSF